MVAYFAYHAFQGDNSLAALKRLEAQEADLTVLAQDVGAERAALELSTSRLNNRSIDPDMLEEQVRQRLGFTHPDEVVVFLSDASH
ncbi:septum formation initiator family protein [Kordiimonas lipolytica]|uniref:Septum formation initiator family protein n=1 Tax=Kordiimonas lipolytica TaxID=1662421 RepID=A0ABV8U8X1_9PROT|nr:septum formation initiator family protein [Kordiimonas lipolytica]